ncbi:Lin1244/Lin1753 domain-containing protein [Bacteroides uniformis]|uniref:Lin1244/Lin1753 domain-containing protein n=1 Tax=Bacteroides uniformis TaxID=820 RepID=UPI0035617CDD
MEAYLLHDANAGSNLKLMIMIQEEGMKGYGIYWTVLEFLRLQNEYKASLKVIPILAQKARVTTATLKRIIYDYALFEVNETSFSSPGLSRRMEPWDAQQEAKKEAGRRGGLVNQQRIRDAKTSSALVNKLNKENKETPSLSPQGETGRRKEEILLTPPEYTLNRQTHNYQGLMEELARQKVTDIHDLNAILRLTDFGKLGGKIWKILYELNSSPQLKARIVMPGKYILKLLRG